VLCFVEEHAVPQHSASGLAYQSSICLGRLWWAAQAEASSGSSSTCAAPWCVCCLSALTAWTHARLWVGPIAVCTAKSHACHTGERPLLPPPHPDHMHSDGHTRARVSPVTLCTAMRGSMGCSPSAAVFLMGSHICYAATMYLSPSWCVCTGCTQIAPVVGVDGNALCVCVCHLLQCFCNVHVLCIWLLCSQYPQCWVVLCTAASRFGSACCQQAEPVPGS
jgi:hypothetical protein